MAGHLFITRGDLLELSCDAILIPCGTGPKGFGHLEDPWRKAVGNGRVYLPEPPDREHRVALVTEATEDAPAVYAGHTGDIYDDPAWYVHAATTFVDLASRGGTRQTRPLDDDRPVLGIPLVGARSGGAAEFKGGIVKHLVKELLAQLRRRDIRADVVLVLRSDAAYAAAQEARDRYQRSWRPLDSAQIDKAKALADKARRGELVLFIGAGVSMGAGLPSWTGLLARLAEDAGFTAAEQRELKRLDPRDAAAVLERRTPGSNGLSDALRSATSGVRGSLLHQLLASLPVREALTTNYDTLFESAWRSAGRQPSILPKDRRVRGDEWLVKLHGSVDAKAPLVLSRDDYMRFEGDSSALAGIVQAMLLTRHLLFVGYSLSDENFHRIVHEVRQTTGSETASGSTFGTVLIPEQTRLVHDIWRDHVDFISTAPARGRNGAVRRLAIFVDLLASEAAAGADHLLDPAFDPVFNDAERALRKTLEDVERAAASPRVRDGLRRAVRDALAPFGGDR